MVQVPTPVDFKAPETIELEKSEGECWSTRDDFFDCTLRAAPKVSNTSLNTPAAPPTTAKDPDKALTNVAIGIFRLNSWPCQEAPGYRSFVAKIKFTSRELGVTSTDNYNVTATGGLLIMESLVLEIPELPGIPMIEALNEINQHSVSSVFVLQEQGVVMRHAVIPRPREDGYFTGAMLLQIIRQMNHDRRHALSVLRQVIERGLVMPEEIAATFAKAAAPCNVPCHALDQLADLAEFAGFCTQNHAGQLAIARERISPARCHTRFTAGNGFLRATVPLGEITKSHYAWRLVPEQLRNLINGKPHAGKPSQLMQQLNLYNRTSGLFHFVATPTQILATAAFFPSDLATTVEEFAIMADALLRLSENGSPKLAPMSKMAG